MKVVAQRNPPEHILHFVSTMVIELYKCSVCNSFKNCFLRHAFFIRGLKECVLRFTLDK